MHSLFRLLRYAKAHRPQVWRAAIFTVLNQLCDLAPAYLIGLAVDIVVTQKNSVMAYLGINSLVGQLGVLSLLTLVIWSLESLFEFLYDRRWRTLAQTLQHQLRLDAYSHLQELELSYFEDRSTGLLLSILNDDINQLERFLNSGAAEILQFSTVVLSVGVSFAIIAPSVAPLAMLPIPVILWGTWIFQKRLAPRYADVREKSSLISDRLTNNLMGIATIKSFTAEAYERDRVSIESEAYRRSNGRAIALSAAFIPVIRFGIRLWTNLSVKWAERHVRKDNDGSNAKSRHYRHLHYAYRSH